MCIIINIFISFFIFKLKKKYSTNVSVALKQILIITIIVSKLNMRSIVNLNCNIISNYQHKSFKNN